MDDKADAAKTLVFAWFLHWSVQKHWYLPGFPHLAERAATSAMLQKPCVLPRFLVRQRPKIDQKTAVLEPSKGLCGPYVDHVGTMLTIFVRDLG